MTSPGAEAGESAAHSGDVAHVDVVTVSEADGVRTLTLNRPEARNALDTELKDRLRDELHAAEADEAVRAVVLAGAGPAFCVGQDLGEHVTVLLAEEARPIRTVAEHYNPIARAIAAMPKPTIAAVGGAAAGAGAAFSFAADLRIAASSASFLMAFASVGLGPDSGASWTLQRLVGYGRAMELMLLGRKVPAEEAQRIGLVTEVVADGEELARAQDIAARLAAGPTVAYRKIKETLAASSGSSFAEALEAEDAAQNELGATADHREAVEAFVGKRAPTFGGR